MHLGVLNLHLIISVYMNKAIDPRSSIFSCSNIAFCSLVLCVKSVESCILHFFHYNVWCCNPIWNSKISNNHKVHPWSEFMSSGGVKMVKKRWNSSFEEGKLIRNLYFWQRRPKTKNWPKIALSNMPIPFSDMNGVFWSVIMEDHPSRFDLTFPYWE